MSRVGMVVFLATLWLQAAQLSNQYIRFQVNPDSGTIGAGLSEDGIGMVYDGAEYLNKIGIPFEFFALKVDGEVYANDNAEGYRIPGKSWVWPREGMRKNDKNIPTQVHREGESIIAETTLPGKFRIIQNYHIGFKKKNISLKNMENNIAIDVTVENLSDRSLKMKYVRGIDMDPPDFKTKNSMGYNRDGIRIDKSDLVYTISAENPGKYPLSLFSENKLPHRGAILAFDKFRGCIYDPDLIERRSVDASSGDAVIYMIFDLGKLKPSEKKQFSLSYYLSKDLRKLVDIIEGKNPKMVLSPKSLRFDLRHHEGNEKKTGQKSFSMDATNSKYIDDGEVKTVMVELPENTDLPAGIRLHVGKSGATIDNTHRQVILHEAYKYGAAIPVWVSYDSNWKEISEKQITLVVGTSNDKGRFDTLNIRLHPLANDAIFPVEGKDTLAFTIPYGEKKGYEKVGEETVVLTSKANKKSVRRATAKISGGTLPSGLRLKVGKRPVGERFSYRFDAPIPVELERNRGYSAKDPVSVTLEIDDIQSRRTIPVAVRLLPAARSLGIKLSPEHPSVKLDKLKRAKPVEVTLLANGKQITGDSFDRYMLRAECEGVKCKLFKDTENRRFLLKVYPSLIEAFTATGDIPGRIELEKGSFPGDKASKDFIYTIEDIGWRKYIDPVRNLLILLLILWYLWGVTGGKKRFKKTAVIEVSPIKRGKPDYKAGRKYFLRKAVSGWQALIPYASQKVSIRGRKFIAYKNNRTFLSKKTQTGIELNNMEIDDIGNKHIQLNAGDYLRTSHDVFTIET